jgi:potassium efflux system protein
MPPTLPLDAGARYALTTLTRYVAIALGVVLGFSALGIGWSKLQWLVAALSVGLGFGLQEIFANFVSGLIILFERPIRVGDVVTVADVSGVVTRIQTRATTVTDWDRKEFIVPNKEFITGRLLNWTRADKINRIVINVGIAYGSDTALARELLEKVVAEHPEVVDDPAPLITFEGFGDSALNFVVRCYLPRLDKRLVTIHDLHVAIDQAFREAGIEIAFPQRDLHLRSGAERLAGPPAVPPQAPAEVPKEEPADKPTGGPRRKSKGHAPD